jgi:hypothetical protein
VKVEWGVSGREGEREREEQIKGVREGACRGEPNMAWVGNSRLKGHENLEIGKINKHQSNEALSPTRWQYQSRV